MSISLFDLNTKRPEYLVDSEKDESKDTGNESIPKRHKRLRHTLKQKNAMLVNPSA